MPTTLAPPSVAPSIAVAVSTGDRHGASDRRADWVTGIVWTSTTIDTPLGAMLAVTTNGGLVVLDFVDRVGLRSDVDRRRGSVGNPAIEPGDHRHLDAVRRQLGDYFAGRRLSFDVPLRPIGTPFQRAAWAALLNIPPGQTRTYGQQAAALGSPAAVRAVGRANGSNLLCVVIPCHRVIGASGHLVGYAGGTDRKAWLLRHERDVLGR